MATAIHEASVESAYRQVPGAFLRRFVERVLTASLATLTAVSCTGTTAAPSSTSGSTPGVRITGLEKFAPFLVQGETVRLKATLTYSHGNGRDCTADAKWARLSVDSFPRIRLSDSVPGELTATVASGTDMVAATCEGQIGTLPITIDVWRLQGLIRELPDSQPAINAIVENADSFYSATSVGPNGAFSMNFAGLTGRVRISKKGFEPMQQEITWNRTPAIARTFDLRPLSTKILETGGTLCWSRGEGGITAWADPNYPTSPLDPEFCVKGLQTAHVYSFAVPRNGRLHVDDYWSLDYDDFVAMDLRCNGSVVASALQQDHWFGRAIDIDARTDCRYALRFRQKSRYPVMGYEFVVSVD